MFDQARQVELYGALKLSWEEVLVASGSNETIQFLRSEIDEPLWVDHVKILHGQKVFETYALQIMYLLGVMSLPYCYAGSPGNKALYISEKMRHSPGKRLADTADFVIHVCTPGNLNHGAIGHYYIRRTRLIHAIARHHVLKGEWNVKSFGLPINQEDMAG